MTPNIKLHEADSYEMEGRVVTTRTKGRQTRYILPSGARISLVHYKPHSVLEIGGFKSITVRVIGQKSDLTDLYDAVT